jgi:hypothetical protein
MFPRLVRKWRAHDDFWDGVWVLLSRHSVPVDGRVDVDDRGYVEDRGGRRRACRLRTQVAGDEPKGVELYAGKWYDQPGPVR